MALEVAREIPAAQLHLELVVHSPGEGGVCQDLSHALSTKLGRDHCGGKVDCVRGESVILEVGSVTINIQSKDLTFLFMMNLIDL